MKKTNGGIAAFKANIEAMRQVGVDNRTRRTDEARTNTENHLGTMNARAQTAADEREARRLAGVARRDAHNEKLRLERAERAARTELLKAANLRGI